MVTVASTPQVMERTIEGEMRNWARLIRERGIKVQ